MKFGRGGTGLEKGEMLHEQRIFEERREKFLFKNQGKAIVYMMNIPVPDFSRFEEKNVLGNGMMRLVANAEGPFSFGYESNVIIRQGMSLLSGYKFLYIFQLHDIYQ